MWERGSVIGSADSLVLIAIVVIICYGWRRLPGAMRDLGRARRILKSEVQAARDEVPLPPKRTIPGETVRPGETDPKNRTGGSNRGR